MCSPPCSCRRVQVVQCAPGERNMCAVTEGAQPQASKVSIIKRDAAGEFVEFMTLQEPIDTSKHFSQARPMFGMKMAWGESVC